MPARKRLRSLASFLWDTGSGSEDELAIPQRCKHCFLLEQQVIRLQGEVERLIASLDQLQAEKLALQKDMDELKGKLIGTQCQLFETEKFIVPLGGAPGKKTCPKSDQSWLVDIGDLVGLQGLQRIVEQWRSLQGNQIDFNLCAQDDMTASRILQHCEWVVHNLSRRHPAVFKVGITENFVDRWCNKPYCYTKDKSDEWQGMTILFVARDSLACSLVESFLIHRFRGRPGCRNIQPGGESAKKSEGPFFTYCVWRLLVPPTKSTGGVW